MRRDWQRVVFFDVLSCIGVARNLRQIGDAIVAAQDGAGHGYSYDTWEVNEPQRKLIPHVKAWRTKTMDPRIRASKDVASANVPVDCRKSDIQEIRGWMSLSLSSMRRS